MISVCYVVSTLERSGPTNQLFDTVSRLDRDRFAPSVLTLSPEPDDSLRPKFRDLGVDVSSLGLSRLDGFLRGRSAIRSFVADRDPDVVHSHGVRADFLSATQLAGYERVSTIHNYPYDDYPRLYGRLKGIPIAWLHCYSLRRLDHPVACSPTVERQMATHGVAADCIPNGVDAERYSPPSRERVAEARRSLDLPPDETVFVSVGAFIERKDPETVIRGFSESGLGDSATLVMVSDGPLFDRCRDLARRDESIRLPGRVEEVGPYLDAADCFVSASHAEGLPLAVLEALSTGLPVCLSDIGPHHDLLDVRSGAGVTFEPGSPSALATAIESIDDADRDAMATAARETVTEELSAGRMAERYQRLYERVAESRSSVE
ncbi:glycosyltransferase family 4 protein [Halorussus lipolyticus]|uniref:glycosyltransferase family 4 protein n=1 Tax=Halorussus lipolyticus TaxID=3034024 RepID=UPI0023E7E31F|nr:glycosyltransferase family 4 protein [Halorussus sp. DT80]